MEEVKTEAGVPVGGGKDNCFLPLDLMCRTAVSQWSAHGLNLYRSVG
jgi:hypothetical protein